MKSVFRASLLAVVFLVPMTAPLNAESPKVPLKNEGPGTWAILNYRVHNLVMEGKFAEVEKKHDDLLISREMLKEGQYAIDFFYNSLDGKTRSVGKQIETNVWFRKIEAWKAAFPTSQLALIAEASTWKTYAWDARGSKWADEVSDENWKLFGERLAHAERILQDVKKNSDGKPQLLGWYLTMQKVALGQGWDLKRYSELFDEAIAAHPDHGCLYFHKAQYLMPRWHGEEGDVEAFAQQMRVDGKPEFYTRILWSNSAYYPGGDLFKSPYVRWEWMKEGFEVMMEKYPDSDWNRSNYCRFACQAGDKETARHLFAELKGQHWKQAWPSERDYFQYLKWANAVE